MIPGLTFGASSAANNGQASWAASWSGKPSASKPHATTTQRPTPSQIAQQKLKEAALTSRASHNQHMHSYLSAFAPPVHQRQPLDLDDDDEHDPEVPMEDGEIDEEDSYEPEMPAEADEQRRDIEADEDDEYDPESYEPDMEMDMSPKTYDSDGCVSPGTRSCSGVVSLPGVNGVSEENLLAVSSGARDAADVIDEAEEQEVLSVIEARKKAQAAILRLWPLEVRFQQYIDEGVDEDIIKDLFKTLGLDKNTGRRISTTTITPTPVSSQQQPAQPQQSPDAIELKANTENLLVSAEPKVSATGEERKDRIARLLALKKSKAASSPNVSASASSASNGISVSKPAIDKGALLKQKMEALKKRQAQKLLGQTTTSERNGNSTPIAPLSSSKPWDPPTGPKSMVGASPQVNSGSALAPRPLPHRSSLIIELTSDEEDSDSQYEESPPVYSGRTISGSKSAATPTGKQVMSLESEIMKLKAQIAEKEARKSISGTASPASAPNVPKPTATALHTLSIPNKLRAMNSTTPAPASLPIYAPRPAVTVPLVNVSKVTKSTASDKKNGTGRQGSVSRLPDVKIALAEKMARLQAVNDEAMQLLKEIQDAQREQVELEIEDEDGEQEYEDSSQNIDASASVSSNFTFGKTNLPLPPPMPIPAAVYYSAEFQNPAAKVDDITPHNQAIDMSSLTRCQRKKLRKRQQQAEAAAAAVAEMQRKKAEEMCILMGKNVTVANSTQMEAAAASSNKRKFEEKAAALKAKLLARGPLLVAGPKSTPVAQSPALVAAEPVQAPVAEPNARSISSDESSSSDDDDDVEMIESEEESEQVTQVKDSGPVNETLVMSMDDPMDVSSDSSSSDEEGEVDEDEVVQDNVRQKKDSGVDVPMLDKSNGEVASELQESADTSSSEGSDSDDSDSSDGTNEQDQEGDANDAADDDDEYEPADVDEPMAEQISLKSVAAAVVRAPTARNANGTDTPTTLPSWKIKLLEQKRLVLENQAAKRAAREKALQEAERCKSEVVEVLSSDSSAQDEDTEAGPVNIFGRRTETSDVIDRSVRNPKFPGAFVPYESIYKGSPLFCFHADFFKEVPKGLRSFTYSNKIDPKWCICTDDLTGQCPDGADKCAWQHLDGCTLSEDKIILHLGSNKGLTEAQKSKYVDGLRKLLVKFKGQEGNGGLEELGRAIIEYRREFLGDESRIRFGDVEI